jgi:inner membrane transporter RhtA
MTSGDNQSQAALSASPSSTAPSGKINLLLAPGMAITAMFCVQLGAGLSKPMMVVLGLFGATAMRLAWAALLLTIIVRPRFRQYDRRQWLGALLLGLAMTTTSIFYFLSIQRIPLGLASAIEFLGPLGVAAAQMRRWYHVLWPVLAAIGVGLLVHDSEGWSIDLLGAAFALLAGGGWASYIVMSKRVGRLFSGHDGLAMSFLFAALLCAPLGYGELRDTLSWTAVLEMAGLATLVPLLPFVLEMSALRRMPTRSFGILMSAEPAIGALVGLFVLGEYLSLAQWIGIACVISASIGAVSESEEAAH